MKNSLRMFLTIAAFGAGLSCAAANFAQTKTADAKPAAEIRAAEDLFVQGYFDAAAKKLDEVIKANPNYADAYAARAMLVDEKDSLRFWQTEKSILESARPDTAKAIELDPHHALANYLLGAIDNEDPDDLGEAAAEQENALLYADQAVAKNPNDPESYYIRSRIQPSSKAAADLTKAISFDSKFGRAYQKRGENYSHDSDYYNALADFNRTIEIFPKSISAYRERAKVYYSLGETDKANADLRRALEFDPKNEHLATLLKSYNEPVSNREIVSRYRFFRSEFDKLNNAYEQQKKNYNATLAARPQKPAVCAALTELETAFQNSQSASDKLLFVNNYSQIAELKQAIADNKIIADYNRETAALFPPEAVNQGCK